MYEDVYVYIHTCMYNRMYVMYIYMSCVHVVHVNKTTPGSTTRFLHYSASCTFFAAAAFLIFLQAF